MYLPLEMTEYETFQRMLIQEEIVYDSEEAKRPTAQQKEEIKKYLTDLEQSGLFTMYYGLNGIADIEKKVKEEEPFLLVVDQLTQVEPVGKAKDIRDKYIQITNALKRIALNEKVCILALHQLNREGEGKKKPTLSNLAESDSVGRDADVVLALNEHEETKLKGLDALDLIIAKNRQGAVGAKIPLHFLGARYTFSVPAPRQYEEEDNRRY
jgi:replicative DNA helicase